jgi:hypothetical protein
MTTQKDQPGPWFYAESSNCDSTFVIVDDFGTQLAEAQRWNSENDKDLIKHAEASARLMTSAPRLYNCLVELEGQSA